MIFLGLLALADPPKPAITGTVEAPLRSGVRLKMITSDNALVAARVGTQIVLGTRRVLSGPTAGT